MLVDSERHVEFDKLMVMKALLMQRRQIHALEYGDPIRCGPHVASDGGRWPADEKIFLDKLHYDMYENENKVPEQIQHPIDSR